MNNLAFEIGIYGGLVPFVIAIAVWWLCWWALTETTRTRYAAALALAAAFCTGYVILPEWAELVPVRHWQWLPYVAALAGVVSPIGLAAGVSRIERGILHALLAGGAAWLLVPDWESLEPSRGVYVALLGGYLFVLATLLDLLPDRLSGVTLQLWLTLAAFAVAGTIAAFVSAKYGQVATVAASSLLGCTVAGWSRGTSTTTRGLIPVFALLIGGATFVGAIEPEPPMYAILLVPAAPLALWLFAWGPLSRLRGIAAFAAQACAVLLPIGIAVAALVIAEQSAL
jgi:hypothetical protein